MPKETAEFTELNPKKSYSPETALSLAAACDIAYKSEKTIKKAVKRWNYEFGAFVNKQKGSNIDTQAFVMTNSKSIVIAFRGSESIEDWITNFHAVGDPGPFTSTNAHEGFQDALFPAVIKIIQTINNLQSKDQEKPKAVWLTGHSLGGALASLFAGMLLENGINVDGLYTFASPRPANHQFMDQLNASLKDKPHYRVVNHEDIVPHLPPEPFYSHSGRRIILSKKAMSTKNTDWTNIRKKMLSYLFDIKNIFEAKIDVYGNHVLHDSERGYLVRLKDELRRSKKR